VIGPRIRGGISPGPGLPSRFAVDPDELDRALAALLDVSTAMTQVRSRLAVVRAEAGRWAADGDLPAAVDGLVHVLDDAAARSQLDARDLADALRVAAHGYAMADRAAAAPPRDAWWRDS
jgi:hypothetical protein